jgi:hypothetical protein
MGNEKKKVEENKTKTPPGEKGGTKAGKPPSSFLPKQSFFETMAADLSGSLEEIAEKKPAPATDTQKHEQPPRVVADSGEAGTEDIVKTDTAKASSTPSGKQSGIGEIRDEDLLSYAHTMCRIEGINNPVELKEKRPDVAQQIEQRDLMGQIFDEEGEKKADTGQLTKISVAAQSPMELEASQMASRNNSQENRSDNAKQPADSTMASVFESQELPVSEPLPNPSPEKSEPSTEEELTKLERYKEVLHLLIKQVEDSKGGSDVIKRAKRTYDKIIKEELGKNYSLTPEHIHFLLDSYLPGKIQRDEKLTTVEEFVLEIGRLRDVIKKYSKVQENKPKPVLPAPAVAQAPQKPVQIQAPRKEIEVTIEEPVKDEPPSLARKIGRYVTVRMVAVVAAVAAFSAAMHATDSFNDLVNGIKKLWEEVLNHSSITLTAKQAMLGYYTAVTSVVLVWIGRTKHRKVKQEMFIQRLKEENRREYSYMVRKLRAIRESSSDSKKQSLKLKKAMESDAKFFYCIDKFHTTADEKSRESVVGTIMKELGFASRTISNFEMIFKSAEKNMMLDRFKELVEVWIPEKMRKDRLKSLLTQDELFREKLSKLFKKDMNGKYVNLTSRDSYTPLTVGHISGEELLELLEKDYNEVLLDAVMS